MSRLDPIVKTLRDIRREQGLSANAVAQRAGISQSTIRHAERNRCSPTLSSLHRWAAALGYALELARVGEVDR